MIKKKVSFKIVETGETITLDMEVPEGFPDKIEDGDIINPKYLPDYPESKTIFPKVPDLKSNEEIENEKQ